MWAVCFMGIIIEDGNQSLPNLVSCLEFCVKAFKVVECMFKLGIKFGINFNSIKFFIYSFLLQQ